MNAFLRTLTIVAAVSLFLGLSLAQAGHPSSRVAEQFFDKLDSADYVGAWGETAQLFKARVPKQKWLDDIVHLRREYGESLGRKLQFMKVLDDVQDLPGQSFLYLLYRSKFSVKGMVAESVTVMIDLDGHWRVAGYDIE